jgi:hypothetical protein
MKINLTIDRFEGETAILKSEDGRIISWPRIKLPEEFKEGQALVFTINTDSEKIGTSENAKDILNEILDIK